MRMTELSRNGLQLIMSTSNVSLHDEKIEHGDADAKVGLRSIQKAEAEDRRDKKKKIPILSDRCNVVLKPS